MSIDRERCIRALREISAYPTASFYEARVASYILGELERLGLPYQHDEYGNIIATYGDSSKKPLAIVSHMEPSGVRGGGFHSWTAAGSCEERVL